MINPIDRSWNVGSNHTESFLNITCKAGKAADIAVLADRILANPEYEGIFNHHEYSREEGTDNIIIRCKIFDSYHLDDPHIEEIAHKALTKLNKETYSSVPALSSWVRRDSDNRVCSQPLTEEDATVLKNKLEEVSGNSITFVVEPSRSTPGKYRVTLNNNDTNRPEIKGKLVSTTAMLIMDGLIHP